ncbi:unnamed protein product [Bursaphelenchus xylophilus]|uniref:(pine wood nematode) hypothetical protein n=1 Tax=Bursaphelenchus xylophilus TaxID=6326 RepID=A0A1I7SSN9_BURXY|nr:unnamed protein product [Bursaphelenchus xylophilus]CAG9097358.1 unnamed protein product [Bursaphelenchus xylophilus]
MKTAEVQRKLSLEDQKRLFQRPVPPLPPGCRDPRPKFKEPVANQEFDQPQLWPQVMPTFMRDFLMSKKPLEADAYVACKNGYVWAVALSDIAKVEKLFFLNNKWKTKLQAYFWTLLLHVQFCQDLDRSHGFRYRLNRATKALIQVKIDAFECPLEKLLIFGDDYFQLIYKYSEMNGLRQMRLIKRNVNSIRIGQLGQSLDSLVKQWPSNYEVLYSKIQDITLGLCFMKQEAQPLLNWIIQRNIPTIRRLNIPLRDPRWEIFKKLDLEWCRGVIDRRSDKNCTKILKLCTETLCLEFYGEFKLSIFEEFLNYKRSFHSRIRVIEFVWHGFGSDYMRLLERLTRLVLLVKKHGPNIRVLTFREGRSINIDPGDKQSNNVWSRVFHFRRKIREQLAENWDQKIGNLSFRVVFKLSFHSFQKSWLGCAEFEIQQNRMSFHFNNNNGGRRECIDQHRNFFNLPDQQFKNRVLREISVRLPNKQYYFVGPTKGKKYHLYESPTKKENLYFLHLDLEEFNRKYKAKDTARIYSLEDRTLIRPSDIDYRKELERLKNRLEVISYRRASRRDAHTFRNAQIPRRIYTNHNIIRKFRVWQSPSLPADLKKPISDQSQPSSFSFKCFKKPKQKRIPHKKISLPLEKTHVIM